MNVALSYCPHDEEQARRWLGWCERLGGCEGHDLYVLPFKGLSAPEILGWRSAEVLRDYAGVRSDWNAGAAVRDASGPNYAFRELARHFHDRALGPWLWMEPDAIPLCAQWLDLVEAEYRRGAKAFMGALVEDGAPRHMSGIAVYPQDLAIRAPNYMRPRLATFGTRQVEAAFNLAGAEDAFLDFHATRLIQQEFAPPQFSRRAEFDALVENGRVIFHADKRGELIALGSNGDDPSGKQSPEKPNPAAHRLVVPRQADFTSAELIDKLAALAAKDGLSKARIVKQLSKAGFIVKAARKKP